MKTHNKLNFFKRSFSQVIFSISLSILLISSFSNSYAHGRKVFMETNCNSDCCGYCPTGAYITYIYVASPHRYNERGDNQIEEYAWVRDRY
jgi:hypothetical protein